MFSAPMAVTLGSAQGRLFELITSGTQLILPLPPTNTHVSRQMERSFSHLLRTSRLATFDKNINQIYTTSGKAKAIGDWGLKRNLPTVLRTHYLTIEQLDTA